MSPVVSVCMPVYNGRAYIRKAVDSVLAQSMEDFELLICDDCSSDETMDIVESYDDPRIRIFRNENNLGLVGNWNRVISYARGKYIKLMMQDDILGTDALKSQVSLLESNPKAVLSIGNTAVIDGNDNVIMKRHRFKRDTVIDGRKYARRSLRGRNIYCEPPNHMYKREMISKIGIYDDSLIYTPDWDYCLLLSEIGDVACTSTEVMRFRISDSQKTSDIYRGSTAAANKDSYQMFIKHWKSGILGLNGFDYFMFRTVIRAAALVRIALLNFKK